MKRPIVSEDLLKLRFVADPQISPDGEKVVYANTHIDAKTKEYKTEIWMAGIDNKQSCRLTTNGSNPAWSPDSQSLAFVSDRSGSKQIWIMNDGLGEAEQLTKMRWGAGSPQWSPDGRKIMFISAVGADDKSEELTKELSKEEREKLAKAQQDKPYVVDRLRYKMNGIGLLPKRTGQIFVIDLETRDVKQLTTGDHPLQSPVWSPCSQYIAFTSNRLDDADLNVLASDLYVVPVTGGELRKLSGSEGGLHAPFWSLDGKKLFYLYSDGKYKGATLPKFYSIDVEGGDAVCLTPDMELPVGVSANSDSHYGGGAMPPVLATNGYIYFVAADKGYANLYRFTAEGGPIEAVSSLKGAIYGFTFDAEGKRAAMALSEPLSPGEVYSFDLVGRQGERLTNVNGELLDGLALSTPEEFNFKSVDNWNVQGWIMKPVNFEPAKKYPAILEIHGGPHTMFGDVFFFEFQLLCARGYTVIYTNPRGSHGYGQEFVDACRGDYGGMDYADLMAAMDWALENVDCIDPERLGVTGGSYGGLMTNWIVGHTNRFKAAVTQRSISNWTSFTGAADIGGYFTEYELEGNPWDNPEKMVKHSPLTYVKQIETPLLIIHGEEDLRCPIEQAEQLFVFLKKLGKTTLFLRFPHSTHELSRSGKPLLRIERLNAIVDWFDKYIPKAE